MNDYSMDVERLKTILRDCEYVHAGTWNHPEQAVDIESLIDVALAALAERDKIIEAQREALNNINQGCSFPEDDLQRAIRDVSRAALEKEV